MDITTIGDLITNYGMAFVLMAYFLVKDWRQTDEIIKTLGSIREVLVQLKTYHNMDEGDAIE